MHKQSFFPRERQFWQLHLGACGALILVSVLAAMWWGVRAAHDAAMAVAWFLPFSLLVLGFRWTYRRWQGAARAPGVQFAMALAWASLGAPLLVLAVDAMLWPWFGGERLSLVWLATDSLQAQVFLAAWIALYLFLHTTRARHATALQTVELKANLREAELRNLVNQLQPHFLFNALNNVRFLIHENPARAESSILALSDLLRASMGQHLHGKQALAQELELVAQYIDILRLQCENRLQFSTQLAPGLERCLVPPLLLQLLVENGFKHGIEQLAEGGCIAVDIRAEGEQLQIQVSNDWRQDLTPSSVGAGLGLANLRQRLHLLYGDQARLAIDAGSARFTVRIDLPQEWAPCAP